ncbi:hypothetical protein NPIL_254211 [Nephila pilipes]|uniref:Uncharacterized protein n=1 Tax=Nephila pilipes TaxID=299642 RepID=A0A8X6PAJ4_NEPPI|nr:hypothetical protein NPIL_680091 [Nephila pilipes]GFT60367.1 hypothetical protein NPIL_254211 [Nephila pilipes]
MLVASMVAYWNTTSSAFSLHPVEKRPTFIPHLFNSKAFRLICSPDVFFYVNDVSTLWTNSNVKSLPLSCAGFILCDSTSLCRKPSAVKHDH